MPCSWKMHAVRGCSIVSMDGFCAWRRLQTWTAARLLSNTRYVACGGGSLLACMYIGVLQELFTNNSAEYGTWVQSLRGIAGTSAGAILAFLLTVGLTPTDMQALMDACDVASIATEARAATTATVISCGAVTTGAAIDALLVDIVRRALRLRCAADAAALTLAQFQAKHKPRLSIVVTNADEGVVEYWSAVTAPDTPVWLALRASVAVPGLFPEVQLNAKNATRYQDGGITCNLPCHLFPAAETLSLFVHVGGSAAQNAASIPVCSGTLDLDDVSGTTDTSEASEASGSGPSQVPPPSPSPTLAAVIVSGATRALKMVQLYMCAAQLGPLRGNPVYMLKCVPCRALTSLGAAGAFAFQGGAATMLALMRDGAVNARAIIVRDALLLLACAGAFF